MVAFRQLRRKVKGFAAGGVAFVLLAVEALNTAIEVLCDHVTPEIHPAIKKAKDLGSVAIFIICCAMVLVAVLALAHFCGLLNHR